MGFLMVQSYFLVFAKLNKNLPGEREERREGGGKDEIIFERKKFKMKINFLNFVISFWRVFIDVKRRYYQIFNR